MTACLIMKLNFSLLELLLPRIQPRLVQCLDSIGGICEDIDSSIDNAIRTSAKDRSEL